MTEGDNTQRRYYPLLSPEQLAARTDILRLALTFVHEELIDLNNPHSLLPDGQKGMRGAHLTISAYILEILLQHLEHDQELAALLQTLLVDPHGKPIA